MRLRLPTLSGPHLSGPHLSGRHLWCHARRTIASAGAAALLLSAVGCEAELPQETTLAAVGIDIYLPDGASLALDGVRIPTGDQVRPTSPTEPSENPVIIGFQGGSERGGNGSVNGVAGDRPETQVKRRYHLAWIRLSVPQPDGSTVVSQFHRATSGPRYWAETETRTIPVGDGIPMVPAAERP